MGKPRIAFIISSLGSGGAERVVTTLANRLNIEYDVYIITFISTKPFYTLNKDIQVIPCFNEIIPSKSFIDALKSNYRLLKKLNVIVKSNKIGLLIGFMTTANVLTTLTGKITRIPIIISERTNPYKQQISRFWKLLRFLAYPFADYVVVQTEIIKVFFKKRIFSNRLIIIPNPIATELTKSRITVKKENIVLNVGRLVDIKAQDILIKAFAKTDNKNWKLVIAGEGPERGNLEQLISEMNLKDKVLLRGRIKEVSHLYNTSKIFAFSSTYEGFPNALIEAMHFGLACVSTDCPTGPSELIAHGSNGYLVPVNNVDQFATYLANLMANKIEMEKFGTKAMASVEDLEAKNVIKIWTALIESSLNRSR